MPPSHSPPKHSTTKTARSALHLLTQRGLPPTPENYTKVYLEVAGEPAAEAAKPQGQQLTAEQKLDNNRELLNLIRTLVSAVTERTGELAGSLDAHNRSMRNSIDALNHTEEKQEILALLQIVSATAHSIHQSVEATHQELVETQSALETMRSELQETRQQMMLDPLTGARNRFSMDITLNQEIARARRTQSKFSVALLDLDHFKSVNDNHGHDAGDQLLLYFTQLSKSVMRESDILFRYGGEEFLMLLPETELRGATFMLERLRAMLVKSPLKYKDQRIAARFSAGVAELQADEHGSHLLQRADRALYAAKNGGRNLIVAAVADAA